ncbi:MAG: hypothetical protein ACKONH_12270 [Planctomycetia bacterium]
MNRRDWLGTFGMGFGGLALAEMLGRTAQAEAGAGLALPPGSAGGVLDGFHVPPRAKRVIYLFQSGGRARPGAASTRAVRPSISANARPPSPIPNEPSHSRRFIASPRSHRSS